MQGQIDLHVHTTASDGVYTPTQIVKKAKELGLVAIGICDHDTIDAVKEALNAGKKFGIEVVPGVEITNYWSAKNRREFHTLGYFYDLDSKILNDTLRHFQQVRVERAKKIVKKLQNLGFAVTYPQVKKLAKGAIGRPHPARAVIENKKTRSFLLNFLVNYRTSASLSTSILLKASQPLSKKLV